jgi:hypothetical protein
MAVAHALHRSGWEVFVPLFAAHGRVDLVADRGNGPQRVQVKTGRLKAGCIEFRCCSNTSNAPRDYGGEVDLFGVYVPELDAAYLVPVGDVRSRKGFLRVEPAKNGQRRGIRWACDYVVGDTAAP